MPVGKACISVLNLCSWLHQPQIWEITLGTCELGWQRCWGALSFCPSAKRDSPGDLSLTSQLVPSAYTAEATLWSTLAFCNVNYSRLKPLRSWMRDGSAEVFHLIKGTDRFAKPGNQGLSVHVWCCFFQPPLAMSYILSILVESQS